MLVESLRHFFTPCPPTLKRLGVLHDLIALDHRAQRQRRAWAPHWTACHRAVAAMIQKALADHEGALLGHRVVILGSGLLLETPLPLLVDHFSDVVCVDLFHMPSVRRQARHYGVHLETLDLTGVIEILGRDLPRGHLPDPSFVLPEGTSGATLVISANCLSQLAGIPLATAEAVGGFRPYQLVDWERAIIGAHRDGLAHLAAKPGVSVGLLCDSRRECLSSRDGTMVDEQDLLGGLGVPAMDPIETWWWDLAPAPEESRRWSVRHRVYAGMVLPVQPD